MQPESPPFHPMCICDARTDVHGREHDAGCSMYEASLSIIDRLVPPSLPRERPHEDPPHEPGVWTHCPGCIAYRASLPVLCPNCGLPIAFAADGSQHACPKDKERRVRNPLPTLPRESDPADLTPTTEAGRAFIANPPAWMGTFYPVDGRRTDLAVAVRLIEREAAIRSRPVEVGEPLLRRNVLIHDGETSARFSGEWVAVPREDFDALRAARPVEVDPERLARVLADWSIPELDRLVDEEQARRYAEAIAREYAALSSPEPKKP